jgi:hypothetical protein
MLRFPATLWLANFLMSLRDRAKVSTVQLKISATYWPLQFQLGCRWCRKFLNRISSFGAQVNR